MKIFYKTRDGLIAYFSAAFGFLFLVFSIPFENGGAHKISLCLFLAAFVLINTAGLILQDLSNCEKYEKEFDLPWPKSFTERIIQQPAVNTKLKDLANRLEEVYIMKKNLIDSLKAKTSVVGIEEIRSLLSELDRTEKRITEAKKAFGSSHKIAKKARFFTMKKYSDYLQLS